MAGHDKKAGRVRADGFVLGNRQRQPFETALIAAFTEERHRVRARTGNRPLDQLVPRPEDRLVRR
jgi:hypothetical protein